MKKLFIYYSNTENCAFVAEAFAKRGYDVCRVHPKKELPRAFILQMLTGGYRAWRKKCTPLKKYGTDVSAYDRVIIGSPIWNGRISAPVNTLLCDEAVKAKVSAFVFCAGGGTAPKAVERVKDEFPGAAAAVLKEPKRHPDELEKLKNLFDGIER
ncbi:MAG: hypothetical protein J5760_03080 [Clostridia bacterium]|nr:hypothetical protein [Clostridia bacterium]